jgi:hypothetical protein
VLYVDYNNRNNTRCPKYTYSIGNQQLSRSKSVSKDSKSSSTTATTTTTTTTKSVSGEKGRSKASIAQQQVETPIISINQAPTRAAGSEDLPNVTINNNVLHTHLLLLLFVICYYVRFN